MLSVVVLRKGCSLALPQDPGVAQSVAPGRTPSLHGVQFSHQPEASAFTHVG